MIFGLNGYIEGQDRNDYEGRLVSHLYKGTFNDPGLPMCVRGWNRSDGERYSIWRGSSGVGTCQICLRRALKGLNGIESRTRKTKWI